jgi:hypothetical protein
MKINGINLHSTFPGEIQLSETCDLIAGMDTNAMQAASEKSGKNSRTAGACQPRFGTAFVACHAGSRRFGSITITTTTA